MPSGWIFALFGILLRMTEGVGLAMFITASFTLLPELYPTRVGLVKVYLLVSNHKSLIQLKFYNYERVCLKWLEALDTLLDHC